MYNGFTNNRMQWWNGILTGTWREYLLLHHSNLYKANDRQSGKFISWESTALFINVERNLFDKVQEQIQMASYKTFFIVFILSTSLVAGLPTSVASSSRDDDTKLRDLKKYSFPDDYFDAKVKQGEAEQRESTENCEQVIKNAMICQVCTDPDTNDKYEQCSYASPSHKKAHGYEKLKKSPEKYEKKDYNSESKKRQAIKRQENSEESEETSSPYFSQYSSSPKKYDGHHDDDNNNSEYDQSSKSSYVPESERISKNMKKHQCEEIERNGMICMVCKDKKTGGNFEKCSFAFSPKESVYKYSTSKSTGVPKEKKQKTKPVEKSQSYRRSSSSEIDESNAREIAETQQVDENGCRSVIKDSMTCKVCVHPVTRENSEQCSYSYTPDDKLYAYTQSRSFGTPKKYSSSDSDE